MLKLVGSRQPERHRRNEPEPVAGKPIKPQWLKGDSAKIWTKVLAQLEAMDVLTKADGAAIARYCKLFARWVKNSTFLDEYGETYPLKGDDGKVKCIMQFPQVSIVRHLTTQILQLEREFGLTPSSRASLNVEGISKTPKVATRQRKA